MSTQQLTLYRDNVVSVHGETKAKTIFVFRRTERPGRNMPYMAKSATATDIYFRKYRHNSTTHGPLKTNKSKGYE